MTWRDVIVGWTDPRIERELDGAVERALRAGAVAPLSFVGAGAQGIVLCDTRGRAFKVARVYGADTAGFGIRMLRDEHDWLRAAAEHPETAHRVARVYALHEDLGVLERECVPGDRPGWREYQHAWEAPMATVPGWLPPEAGENQWVVSPEGPKLVDAGFAMRKGEVLAEHVRALLNLEKPWYDERPSELAYALYVDAREGRLERELAAPLLRGLRAAGDASEWSSERRVQELLGRS